MKRKGQLELDDERPDPKHITIMGGTECWYYQGPIPPTPPRSLCPQCNKPTHGPALFYGHDRTYRWWCRQCGLVPPLFEDVALPMFEDEKPELSENNPGSNNQSARTITMSGPKQLELLPSGRPTQGKL